MGVTYWDAFYEAHPHLRCPPSVDGEPLDHTEEWYKFWGFKPAPPTQTQRQTQCRQGMRILRNLHLHLLRNSSHHFPGTTPKSHRPLPEEISDGISIVNVSRKTNSTGRLRFRLMVLTSLAT